MIKVYQLINHPTYIKDLQNAALSSNPHFGLQITHGLCGSREWWDNIKNGKLKKLTHKGKITKVYWTAMNNDTPVFDMVDENGKTLTYNREADSKALFKKYKEGNEIEIDYVVQKFKEGVDTLDNKKETEIELEIRIGEETISDDCP